jgi:hypothetical protein
MPAARPLRLLALVACASMLPCCSKGCWALGVREQQLWEQRAWMHHQDLSSEQEPGMAPLPGHHAAGCLTVRARRTACGVLHDTRQCFVPNTPARLAHCMVHAMAAGSPLQETSWQQMLNTRGSLFEACTGPPETQRLLNWAASTSKPPRCPA